jgi:hypothetical protein
MKMVQALSMPKGAGAMRVLEEHAFRPEEESTLFDGMVAGFQIRDRMGADARQVRMERAEKRAAELLPVIRPTG